MKKFIGAIVMLAISLTLSAQGTMSDADLIAAIAGNSASIKSFSCKFKQTQTVALLTAPVVSTGEMQYQGDGKIFWKYTSPNAYELVVTPKAVTVHNGNGISAISLEDNPLMARLMNMLVGIMGGSNIASPEGFKVGVSASDKAVALNMSPTSRATSKMFKSIVLTFTPKDLLIETVTIEEADGSTTAITFYDRQAR